MTKDAIQKLKNSPKPQAVRVEQNPEHKEAVKEEPPQPSDQWTGSDIWQPFLELRVGETDEEKRHRQELVRIEASYENREKKLEETNLKLIQLVNGLDLLKGDIEIGSNTVSPSPETIEMMKKVQSCIESNMDKTLNCSKLVNEYLFHKKTII